MIDKKECEIEFMEWINEHDIDTDYDYFEVEKFHWYDGYNKCLRKYAAQNSFLKSQLAEKDKTIDDLLCAIKDIIEHACSTGIPSDRNLKIGDRYYHNSGLSCYEAAFCLIKDLETKEGE